MNFRNTASVFWKKLIEDNTYDMCPYFSISIKELFIMIEGISIVYGILFNKRLYAPKGKLDKWLMNQII